MSSDACLDCRRGPLIPAWRWSNGDRGEGVRNGGRGLCSCCYERHHRHGTLDRFPASNRPPLTRAVVLAQYRELAAQGLSVSEIARRIGIERTALYGHLRREQQRPARLSDAELARLRQMVGVS